MVNGRNLNEESKYVNAFDAYYIFQTKSRRGSIIVIDLCSTTLTVRSTTSCSVHFFLIHTINDSTATHRFIFVAFTCC